jgi:hypothetical protein
VHIASQTPSDKTEYLRRQLRRDNIVVVQQEGRIVGFIAATGKCDLPAEIARRVLDLDHLPARALQIMRPEVMIDWLEGTEPTLGFTRPIDVLGMEACAPLLKVLDRPESGAYA